VKPAEAIVRRLAADSRGAATLLRATVLLCGAAAALVLVPAAAGSSGAGEMHRHLHEAQIAWYQAHPVQATLAGKHDWDRLPPNHAPYVLDRRRERVRLLLMQAGAGDPAAWSREDRIDDALYHALLEGELFEMDTLRRVERDASLPLEEAILGIFSHMIRESPARLERAKWAFWRLKGIPSALDISYRSLSAPEAYGARRALRLAAAIPPLFNEKLTALARGIPPNHQAELRTAQRSAESSLGVFEEALRPRIAGMPEMRPLGKAAYERMLQRAHLLPLTAAEAAGAAESELARAKALAGDPGKKNIAAPAGRTRSILLRGAEAALGEMAADVREAKLVTQPGEALRFEVREMPEAVALAFPDGLAVPAGPFEPDVASIFFIPPGKTQALGFYLDDALADPKLLLAAQAVPGRALAAAVWNGLGDEARRWSRDIVTVNGWTHYAEELALDAGLFDGDDATRAAAIRLMRSHAARALVEIRYHTESWTLEQAVAFLAEEEEGLTLAEAKEEALRAASKPGEAMSWTIGKWQIRELRRKVEAAKGAGFSLQAFDDAFLAAGPIPISLVEWEMTGDDAAYRKAIELGGADKTPPPAPGAKAGAGPR